MHADIRDADGDLPLAIDFHAPTILWALENAEQIALWCERGTSRHAEVVAWTVNTAHAGSRFQTIVNATPEHAAHWLAYIHRWKGKRAQVPAGAGRIMSEHFPISRLDLIAKNCWKIKDLLDAMARHIALLPEKPTAQPEPTISYPELPPIDD